jgi:hypothetical protein
VVPAEGDHLGALDEVSNTLNRGVFLVEGGVLNDLLLDLLDDGENEGLAVVVSVSTDTKVDLLGILVILEACGQRKDGISGGHLDVGEVVHAELGKLGSELTVEQLKSFHLIVDLLRFVYKWMRH